MKKKSNNSRLITCAVLLLIVISIIIYAENIWVKSIGVMTIIVAACFIIDGKINERNGLEYRRVKILFLSYVFIASFFTSGAFNIFNYIRTF